ncbi:MAG: major facilitator superfamily domain-containing protein [Monoraphidium minutum]|nr:MAG: major facilitator superfamily domain-containing protein [Monoraphidium minutum]
MSDKAAATAGAGGGGGGDVAAVADCSSVPPPDTIYLPALVSIERDLNTTATMTAASVSLYLVMVGLAALLWGPVADRFGRRLTLFVSSLLFLGTTLVCVFAPTIEVLVAFRALQGAAISAYSVGTSAVMADVFPPEQRGRSMGLLSIPILVGPVIGPLMGGGLSYSLGWRSTFVAMAVMGGAIFVGLIIFLEETSHPHVARQLSKSHSKLNLRQPSFLELPDRWKLLHPVFNISRLRPYKANDATQFPGREFCQGHLPTSSTATRHLLWKQFWTRSL